MRGGEFFLRLSEFRLQVGGGLLLLGGFFRISSCLQRIKFRGQVFDLLLKRGLFFCEGSGLFRGLFGAFGCGLIGGDLFFQGVDLIAERHDLGNRLLVDRLVGGFCPGRTRSGRLTEFSCFRLVNLAFRGADFAL